MLFQIKENKWKKISAIYSEVLAGNKRIKEWLDKKEYDNDVAINLILNDVSISFAEWFFQEFTKKQKMKSNYTESDFLNELKASYELMIAYKSSTKNRK